MITQAQNMKMDNFESPNKTCELIFCLSCSRLYLTKTSQSRALSRVVCLCELWTAGRSLWVWLSRLNSGCCTEDDRWTLAPTQLASMIFLSRGKVLKSFTLFCVGIDTSWPSWKIKRFLRKCSWSEIRHDARCFSSLQPHLLVYCILLHVAQSVKQSLLNA